MAELCSVSTYMHWHDHRNAIIRPHSAPCVADYIEPVDYRFQGVGHEACSASTMAMCCTGMKDLQCETAMEGADSTVGPTTTGRHMIVAMGALQAEKARSVIVIPTQRMARGPTTEAHQGGDTDVEGALTLQETLMDRG